MWGATGPEECLPCAEAAFPSPLVEETPLPHRMPKEPAWRGCRRGGCPSSPWHLRWGVRKERGRETEGETMGEGRGKPGRRPRARASEAGTGTDREPEDKGREGGGWGVGSGERGRKGPRRSRRETGRDPRPEGRTRNPKERLPSRRCSLRGKDTGGQSWPRRGAGEPRNRQEPHLQHPGNKPRGSARSDSSSVFLKPSGFLPQPPTPAPNLLHL